MRIPDKWAKKLKLYLSSGKPANGVVPRIIKNWKNGKYMGRVHRNTITTILPNNFEFHCSELEDTYLVAKMP